MTNLWWAIGRHSGIASLAGAYNDVIVSN
jgi:hypothetical protein